MGHFADKTAAQKYAEYRPYFHPVVMDRIREVCGPLPRTSIALDVACGTGQSAVALKSLVDHVVATDLALEMLAQAPIEEGINYVQSEAERLPIADSTIDLITVSLAFHWFKRNAFLAEASRVLRPNSYMVIYNNFFYGPRDENPAFTEWQPNAYPHRYPAPVSNFSPPSDDQVQQHGLAFTSSETCTNYVTFTPETFTHYLMTQSNIITALNSNASTYEEIYRNILAEVHPLFTAPTLIFRFGGPIWFLRKV